MLTSLAAFVMVCSSAQQPNLVTLKPRLGRLPNVLNEVSEKIGTRVDCIPLFENEVLLLDVKDMPVDQLLAEIADATSGRWDDVGTGKRLVPDPAKWQAEQREYAQTKLKELRSRLASGGFMPGMDAAAGSAAAGSAAPDSPDVKEGPKPPVEPSALSQILNMIDLNRLVNRKPGERLVFSTNANRMQVQLPDRAKTVIARWVQKHNQALSNAPKSDTDDADMGAFAAMIPAELRAAMEARTRPVPGYAKANLTVSSGGNPLLGSVASLNLYDAQGKVLLSDTLPIDGGMMGLFGEMFSEMGEAFAGALSEQPQEEVKLTFSEESLEYAGMTDFSAMISGASEGKQPKKASDRVMRMMSMPEQYDPLSFKFAEAMSQSRPAEAKSTVAYVSDLAWRTSAGTVQDFRTQLEKSHTATLKEGVWRVVPKLKHAARMDRSNRIAYGEFFRAAESKGYATLDEACAFAARVASPNQTSPLYALVGKYLTTGGFAAMMGDSGWPLMRWYGSLDPGVKGRILSGQPVSFGSLPGGPTALYLYGDSSKPGTGTAETDMFSSLMMGMAMGMFAGSYQSEPTEVMPNGLPSQGVLTVTAEDQPYFVISDEAAQSAMGIGSFGIEEMAMFQLMMDNDKAAAEFAGSSFPKEARLGARRHLKFRFEVAPGIFVKGSLNDDRLDRNAPKVPLKSLPENVQKQVAARKEKLKSSPFGQMINMGMGMGFPGMGGPPPQ